MNIERHYAECSRCHRMIPVLLERRPTEMERRTFTCMVCRQRLRGYWEANELEQYVRSKWERAEFCPQFANAYRSDIESCCISLGGRMFTRANVPDPNVKTEAEAWQAAYDYTLAREEKIQRKEVPRSAGCCDTEELNDQGLANWRLHHCPRTGNLR